MLTLETLPHQIQSGEVDTVVVAFPDLQGRPVGKRVTGAFFLEHVLHHGIEVCDYLLACDVDMEPLPGYHFANWETGYGDLNAVVDPGTVRPLPWLPGSVLVLCDLPTMEGKPVEVSPRRILRRQIERAAAHGLDIKCATELEFYLFRDSSIEAAEKAVAPVAAPCRHHRGLPAPADLAGGVRHRPDPQPDGRGRDPHRVLQGRGRRRPARDQHHLRRSPSRSPTATWCSRAASKRSPRGCGRSVTFMAKWSMATAGSSCHIHTSLWDAATGAPLSAPETATNDPTGLSTVGRQFLAGQLHAARQLAWCFAPYVNSYRRYVPDSWAPTAVVWGEDNRTCGFRTVGEGPGRRVESRIPGADVNPYLALAASIAGGLWGIEHELELEPAFTGNAYQAPDVPRIPSTLVEAIDDLAGSEVAAEAFGPEVHHHLLNTARQEWAAANRVVTDWELARNFERI